MASLLLAALQPAAAHVVLQSPLILLPLHPLTSLPLLQYPPLSSSSPSRRCHTAHCCLADPRGLPLVDLVESSSTTRPTREQLGVNAARALLASVACLAGTEYTTVKLLNEWVGDPSAVAVLRSSLGVLAMVPMLWAAARTHPRLASWPLARDGLEIGVWIALGYVVQSLALQTAAAGVTAFLLSLTVVVCPALESYVERTDLSPRPSPVRSLHPSDPFDACCAANCRPFAPCLFVRRALEGKRQPAQVWFAAALAAAGVGLLECGGDQCFGAASGDMLGLMQPLFFGLGFYRLEKAMSHHQQHLSHGGPLVEPSRGESSRGGARRVESRRGEARRGSGGSEGVKSSILPLSRGEARRGEASGIEWSRRESRHPGSGSGSGSGLGSSTWSGGGTGSSACVASLPSVVASSSSVVASCSSSSAVASCSSSSAVASCSSSSAVSSPSSSTVDPDGDGVEDDGVDTTLVALALTAWESVAVLCVMVAWAACDAGSFGGGYGAVAEAAGMAFGGEHVGVGLALVWMALICTVGASVVEANALAVLTSTDATVVFATEPLWASAFAAVTLGETMGSSGYAGGALIVGACLLSSYGPDRNGSEPDLT